ncbi:MAG: T9SS type A sorting domain-containing protein [Lewinella sp.]|jgi:hypothetical protein|uniref:T9SS type A sorting domain-containing protein n=1 Tax=Lewinella sp. TaxID=2004506 RepID=UPI003D6AB889
MKKVFTYLSLMLLTSFGLQAQQALDFTFTDTHGDTHNMQHALDQGYIVIIDFFFVNCGPCQQSSPELVSITEDYTGQGKNVIMWSLSDRDSDAAIAGFESQFGFTSPAGGVDGGADDVVNLYASNFNFTGFPTVSIICPDGGISWDIWPYSSGAPEWRSAIDACGVVDAAPYVPMSATRVEEVAALTSLLVAPNPTSGVSTLKLDLANTSTLNIGLYNAQGAKVQQIFAGQLLSGQHNMNVDLSELPAGAYWVRLQNEQGETSSLPLQKI